MKGYYKCDCGVEYISGFAYEECRCLQCNNIVKKLKEVTEKESKEIINTWNAK